MQQQHSRHTTVPIPYYSLWLPLRSTLAPAPFLPVLSSCLCLCLVFSSCEILPSLIRFPAGILSPSSYTQCSNPLMPPLGGPPRLQPLPLFFPLCWCGIPKAPFTGLTSPLGRKNCHHSRFPCVPSGGLAFQGQQMLNIYLKKWLMSKPEQWMTTEIISKWMKE